LEVGHALEFHVNNVVVVIMIAKLGAMFPLGRRMAMGQAAFNAIYKRPVGDWPLNHVNMGLTDSTQLVVFLFAIHKNTTSVLLAISATVSMNFLQLSQTSLAFFQSVKGLIKNVMFVLSHTGFEFQLVIVIDTSDELIDGD
jgi:hypothetical protein